jgi:hypothetical protein
MTGRDFRTSRTQARIPQFPVSSKAGIDRSKLSLYECGYVELTDAEVVALEKALRALIKERAKYLLGVLSSVGPEPEKEVAV